MMHKCEVYFLGGGVFEQTYKQLMEEALHISAKHVEALEVQRKRQEADSDCQPYLYMKKTPQTDAMQNILTDFYMKEVPQTDVLNDILTGTHRTA